MNTGSLNNISYYEYKPSNVTSSTKVIFAFHGIGASSGDMGTFGAYTQIDSIAPNAVVVYPTKGYGVWSASTYGKFCKDYISQNGYTGQVSYYGFSEGALDGPGIIQNAGIFTNAVFVDEDFINYSSGLDNAYNKLSSLQNLKVFCGQYCDTTNNLNAFSTKFSNAGKNFQLDSQSTKTHAQMNSYAAVPGISFLLSATGGSSVTTTNDIPTLPTNITTEVNTTRYSVTAPPISTGGAAEVQPAWCPLGDDVTQDLVGILRIMKILAPILVVIYTTYDTVLALTKGEIDKEQKELFNKFAKRVAAAILLFVIPVIVDQMAQLMNVWDDTGHCVLTETEVTGVDADELSNTHNVGTTLTGNARNVATNNTTTSTSVIAPQLSTSTTVSVARTENTTPVIILN